MQTPRGPAFTWERAERVCMLMDYVVCECVWDCHRHSRTLEALADVTGLGEELEETLLLQLP